MNHPRTIRIKEAFQLFKTAKHMNIWSTLKLCFQMGEVILIIPTLLSASNKINTSLPDRSNDLT